jgi:hypothetical protein
LLRVRGLLAGALVGIPVILFLLLWMHATREFGIVIGCGIGLAIFMVVVTGTDAHDAAADAAWQVAAPDLPPVMDRAAMERDQASMPGPVKPKRGGALPREGRDQTPPAPIAGQGDRK